MEFIPAGSNPPAQVKTVVEQIQGLPLRAFAGFLLANEGLDLMGQQATNRGRTPSGDDLGFLNGFPIQADCNVLLFVALGGSHSSPPFTYSACSTYFTCSQAHWPRHSTQSSLTFSKPFASISTGDAYA